VKVQANLVRRPRIKTGTARFVLRIDCPYCGKSFDSGCRSVRLAKKIRSTECPWCEERLGVKFECGTL
jgi:transcription elongation factor Elf1